MTNNHKLWAAALILCCGIIAAPVKAQDQEDNSILAEGPRLTVVRENGVSAWKFISRTGSAALVHFRKHDSGDAFAVHVTDWDTFHMKTGWLYFSRTALSFESDDDKQRNFQAPLAEVKKVKGQKDYRGWNYLVIKIGGKEKKFMINFDPVPPSRTGPWGAHQKPVFDLIERLFTDYEGVSRDFQERLSKLQKEPDATTATAPAQTAAAIPSAAANIEITSEPSGSEIYVDGVFNSSTPAKLSLAIGEHLVRVSRPGFKNWERKIVVDGTSAKTFNAILEKN
jgi:hypothetical protein